MNTRIIACMCAVMLLFSAVSVMAEGQQEGASPGVTDTEVVIGSTQALSGPVATIGGPVAEGLKAYFNWVNKNGGVNGRQIKLVLQDDQFNPANTNFLTRRLVERDGVFAIVGSLGTPCVLSVMDYLNNRGVPFIYPAAGATGLAVPPKKYVFPYQPNYLVEGNIMVRYFAEQRNFTRIAVVYRNADDGQGGFASMKEKLKDYPNVELVEAIGVDPGATDFSAIIRRLAAAKPQGIALITFSPQTESLVKQAYDFGLTEPLFLANYANSDPSLIERGGAEAMEGFEAMAWLQVDFEDPDLPVWEIWRDHVGDPEAFPNAFVVGGMVAAEVFTEGLRRAGRDLTREGLVAAMEGFDGWSGMLANDVRYGVQAEDTNNTSRLGKLSMYIMRVENGNFTIATDWIDFAPVE